MTKRLFVCYTELLIASEDKIEVFSFHSDEFDDEHDEQETDDTTNSVLYHLHQKVVVYSTVHIYCLFSIKCLNWKSSPRS